MGHDNKIIGNDGEQLAADFLINEGYEIIERNYRFHKGEIDIVARDKQSGYIVFVEVKTRTSLEFGDPVFALTASKKKQLYYLGNCYIMEKKLKCDCRFDAVAITKLPGKMPEINHYINIIN